MQGLHARQVQMPRLLCKSTLSGLSGLTRRHRHWYWYGLGTGLLLAAIIAITLPAARNVHAQPSTPLVSSDASCGALAGVDRTATNGSNWGQTILPGYGAPGGWFGVDVCANGINAVSGDSSSVSCDRMPANWNLTGCAPGQPTSDGYGWTFQCPELIVRFSAWAYGDSPADWGRSGWGNAPDLWTSANHPADFVAYANGSTVAPVPGDILIWGSLNSLGQPWPAGPDGEHGGHVAVVAAVTDGFIVTAEQNVKWGNQDHPSDRLALTEVDNRWILSGSEAHVTQLPTYRWQGTMGNSRGTYGWLHSVRNTGHFPSSSRGVSVAAHGTGTTLPQQLPGGFPSLEAATVITSNGELNDLVWSNSDFFNPNSSGAGPHAALRSLGAPPGTLLMDGERPATITLSDGSRMSYVVGVDRHLYALDVSPTIFGDLWTDLGHPAATLLAGTVSASTYAGGLGVLAMGNDGNLWWRAGPPDQLGSWQEISKPAKTQLAGSFVLAGTPGQGTPLILALGANGRLYERVWVDTQFAADGSVEVPATWSDWSQLNIQPPDVSFSGSLVTVTETAEAHEYIGAWADTPLDIGVLDTQGHLWWFRTSSLKTGWQIAQVAAPVVLRALLGGAVVDGPPTRAEPLQATQLLHLYTTSTGRSDMLSLQLPTNDAALASVGSWTQLPVLPPNAGLQPSGAVVPLGQDESVLVIPAGTAVLVGGKADSTSLLIPAAGENSLTPPATNLPTVWLRMGSSLTAPAFTDALIGPSLDPRWAMAGSDPRTVPGKSGLSLLSDSGGAAALLQSAEAGDFQLSVYVMLPAASSGRAGLVLYTDDNDWLTLLVDQTGHISLCAEAWQSKSDCVTVGVSGSSVARGIWLQLARQGTSFTGASSLDDVIWRPVGSWTPPTTDASVAGWNMKAATPQPSPTGEQLAGATPADNDTTAGTPTSAPLASLAFTSWGILCQGSFDDLSAPGFSDFTVLHDSSLTGATPTG